MPNDLCVSNKILKPIDHILDNNHPKFQKKKIKSKSETIFLLTRVRDRVTIRA